ncbi:beta-phosphoglucomutase [Anaerosporobacter sp.]|uniref:beta-phosphoglucomutase n=1 Tax=Anaerosporobacter sp. TaxID=1872529 RepID=UPI00286F5BBE|nr:beta-phosphoglucomutase [Anaerosporobacter sp.]
MIKGIIFDLDGVLVSTDELHYEAWKQLAEELGITSFTKEDNEKQRGVSRMESLEIVLNKGDKVYSEEEKEALAERKNDCYKELLETLDDSAVLSGVKEAISYLKEKGLLIGVGSVSKNTPVILQKTGLESYIDKVSCGLDITNSKPDPEVFLVAAKKLELEPEECLVVEDSEAGIVAAKAAGMKSLGVGPYYKSLGATYEATGLDADIDWESILEG